MYFFCCFFQHQIESQGSKQNSFFDFLQELCTITIPNVIVLYVHLNKGFVVSIIHLGDVGVGLVTELLQVCDGILAVSIFAFLHQLFQVNAKQSFRFLVVLPFDVLLPLCSRQDKSLHFAVEKHIIEALVTQEIAKSTSGQQRNMFNIDLRQQTSQVKIERNDVKGGARTFNLKSVIKDERQFGIFWQDKTHTKNIHLAGMNILFFIAVNVFFRTS